jgi:hypothetical protein
MTGASRRFQDRAPTSALPLAYFALAHLSLLVAFAALALRPDLPGGFFYHPRMIALVHLITVGWISGSILGAIHIVAPLALGLPLPVGRADWVAFGSFAIGLPGMAAHFWLGTYEGMAWSAGMVTATILWVAVRVARGLPRADVSWPVAVHVGLAFANILAAAAVGILIGLNQTRGFLASPLALMFVHLHLAAVGWATMMVVGLAYRLIPMFLPAAMPKGARLALSAVLLETGLLVTAWALLSESAWLIAGAVLIAGGFVSFVHVIRGVVKQRMPRPPALPRRDWSVWQSHAAMFWCLATVSLGLALAFGVPGDWFLATAWIYGVAGLVGFLTQMVVGMQGRLVPLYAWYRARASLGGGQPDWAANALPSAGPARVIFLLWAAGVPLLAWSLAAGDPRGTALAASLLTGGVALNGAYLLFMLRRATEQRHP